jgi:hypothetical protein
MNQIFKLPILILCSVIYLAAEVDPFGDSEALNIHAKSSFSTISTSNYDTTAAGISEKDLLILIKENLLLKEKAHDSLVFGVTGSVKDEFFSVAAETIGISETTIIGSQHVRLIIDPNDTSDRDKINGLAELLDEKKDTILHLKLSARLTDGLTILGFASEDNDWYTIWVFR